MPSRAVGLTGFACATMVARRLPLGLEPLIVDALPERLLPRLAETDLSRRPVGVDEAGNACADVIPST